MPFAVIIASAIVALNAFTFTAFGLDKRKAQLGQRRTPEATLLWMAFLGGTPGAYLGRRVFRHKTRKQPFCSNLNAIAFVQVIAAGLFAGWYLAG